MPSRTIASSIALGATTIILAALVIRPFVRPEIDSVTASHNSLLSNEPAYEQVQADTTSDNGWHSVNFASTLIPVTIAFPDRWRVSYAFSVGSAPEYAPPYITISDDFSSATVDIQTDTPLPGVAGIDDVLRYSDFRNPSMTTLDGLPAVQGYQSFSVEDKTINNSKHAWEVFSPEGRLYQISFDCPVETVRAQCRAIVSKLHFVH